MLKKRGTKESLSYWQYFMLFLAIMFLVSTIPLFKGEISGFTLVGMLRYYSSWLLLLWFVIFSIPLLIHVKAWLWLTKKVKYDQFGRAWRFFVTSFVSFPVFVIYGMALFTWILIMFYYTNVSDPEAGFVFLIPIMVALHGTILYVFYSFFCVLFVALLERKLRKLGKTLVYFIIIILFVAGLASLTIQIIQRERLESGIYLRSEKIDENTEIVYINQRGIIWKYVNYTDPVTSKQFYVVFDYYAWPLNNSLEFIRDNLPEDVIITAMPRHGHTIRSYTKREVVAYLPSERMVEETQSSGYFARYFGVFNNSEGIYNVKLTDDTIIRDIERVFSTSSVEELYGIMEKYDSDYILVNHEGAFTKFSNRSINFKAKVVYSMFLGEEFPGFRLIYEYGEPPHDEGVVIYERI
jgi:hypothetical protein